MLVWQSNYSVLIRTLLHSGRGPWFRLFFFLSLHSSLSGPGIISAHHPHTIMKQTFSFPLGFSMQLWLAVPCNSELLLEHLFTVGRFSLLHFNKFGINLCTIFPQNVSQILAWQLRNVGWFFPCPKRASVCAFSWWWCFSICVFRAQTAIKMF